jgi:3-dehydroquinate dehydratase-2
MGPLRILVISGPNLDRLGTREPEIYGKDTLADVHRMVTERAVALGAEAVCAQSNHEGDLVTRIGRAKDDGFDGILVNAGAYTHTSIAIFDAIKAAGLPTIEVHLSNPAAREVYRRRSRIAPACLAKVAGFGARSYTLALEGLVDHLRTGSASRSVDDLGAGSASRSVDDLGAGSASRSVDRPRNG